ncbi:BMC domain-containing protein [Fusobacterium sp.]|uniref:BMC domain-containing protein n=1 Tax=Fusobacterium sp. TaxID=68766 RepID=UPI002E76B63B|nr:BMC domain-containing protein [Fusobacterium sp.]MEE1475273.1 BMC domain-containing protein [Fusobacterium sp.]
MKTIGVVEFNNIPNGIKNLDLVLKKSDVKIYKAGVTCPGKYYFIIYGDNEDVKSAFEEVTCEAKFEIISGVSNKVIEILERRNKKDLGSSIGIIEFFTISESVKALDMILKGNTVETLKLILGNGIAGKSYFVITGDTSSVTEAINSVDEKIRYREKSLINNPSENIIKFI